MAVQAATSTEGKYKTYSSENATLATVLSEVLNELEQQGVSLSNINFALTYDAGNSKYAFLAICKNL